jgi:hypothetical protein
MHRRNQADTEGKEGICHANCQAAKAKARVVPRGYTASFSQRIQTEAHIAVFRVLSQRFLRDERVA